MKVSCLSIALVFCFLCFGRVHSFPCNSHGPLEAFGRFTAFRDRFKNHSARRRVIDSSGDESLCERFQIFQRNEQRAKELTANPLDSAEYSAEHSPFGDLTPEEFISSFLMSPPLHQPIQQEQKADEDAAQDSEQVDWTSVDGVVSSVKDQGTLGTCYIFSAAGVVEGQLAIQHGKKNISLSVEHSLECNRLNEPSTDNAVCGEFGGWPFLVLEFWKHGFVEDSKWTYCAGELDKSLMPLCLPCMAKGYDTRSCGKHNDLYCNASSTFGQGEQHRCTSQSWLEENKLGSVTSWHQVSTNEQVIASNLAKQGPLSATLDATMLQLYRRGIANPWLCSKTTLNHSVVLVGFGTQHGKLFWKAKASWGSSWGEDGFFRIVRGKGTCGINAAVYSAQVNLPSH